MDKRRRIKIGIVIPEQTGDFQQHAEALAEELGIIPVFCTGHFGSILPTVRRLIQENPDLEGFIARSVTAAYLRDNFDLPVVGMEMSDFDFCNTIAMLPDKRGRFLVVQFNPSPSQYDVEAIARICGIALSTIFLDTEEEYDVAEEVRRTGANRVVSSVGVVTEPCRAAGIEVIPLRFSKSMIRTAMLHMINLIEAKNKERQKAEQLLHILNAMTTGVLAVDGHGKIIAANKVFCEMIDYPYPSFIGADLSELRSEVAFIRMLTDCSQDGIFEYEDRKYAVGIPEFLTNNIVHDLWTVNTFASVQENATVFRRKLTENGYRARYHFSDIISVSPAMEQLKERAKQYAKTSCNVLILGESGTGKEMLAQSIHNASEYKDGPFVAINCAALPENLLESELFGYEEGAFTGARKGGKEGLIELSNRGTLFLDEIGLMPLSIQVKLLRSLQERRIRRVGGTREISVENRIISATNNSLVDDVASGKFREDLFYRLDVLDIHVPPLRERTGDIPFLVQVLLRRKSTRQRRSLEMNEALLRYLNCYHWPGNFRQLESFVERMIALSDCGEVKEGTLLTLLEELPGFDRAMMENQPVEGSPGMANSQTEARDCYAVCGTLADAEEQMIREAYERCNGDIGAMIRLLDISRTTLWRKMKKLNML